MLTRISDLWHRLLHWEYWPGYIVNAPAMLAWAWYAIRAGHPYFFSAANPAIETGGLWGESKRNILQRIPAEYLPATVFIPRDWKENQILQALAAKGIPYPVIAKPDIGERGHMVEKIENQAELNAYIERIRPVGVDFMIQEYVPYTCELAVLYYRFPHSTRGTISSVCIKDFLTVTGDGRKSIRQLVLEKPRARFQYSALYAKYGDILDTILPQGEQRMLVPIGNHRLGTAFLNGAALIDESMTAVFDNISLQLEGMYYGRFDLRCRDIESLKKGETIRILEYNGVGSDPAHIYDPGYSFFSACLDFIRHWGIIYQIGVANKKAGANYMSHREARAVYRHYKKVMRAMTK